MTVGLNDNGTEIHVPEEYEYGYLDLECRETSCEATRVTCSSDHKDTTGAIMEYNQTTSEYECTEHGASYCCPFGKRILYQPDGHVVSGSDFDYNLVNLTRYIMSLVWKHVS